MISTSSNYEILFKDYYETTKELLNSDLYKSIKSSIECLYELVMPARGTYAEKKYIKGSYLKKIVSDLIEAGKSVRKRNFNDFPEPFYNLCLKWMFEHAELLENSIIDNYLLKKQQHHQLIDNIIQNLSPKR